MTAVRIILLACVLTAAGPVQQPARATELIVHLVTANSRGSFMFEPPIVYAQPGDSVRFVLDDAMHAVKSIPGMMPDGAAPWRGRMGEEIVVQLDRPGVYGVKCRAGYEVGMVGLLVVGDDPPNFLQAQRVRHPPAASLAFRTMFSEVGCHLHLAPCEG